MEDFLYLFRNTAGNRAMSPEEMERTLHKWRAWIGELAQAGHFKGGEPLDRGGKVLAGRRQVVTDGPFAESKEVVGGYLIVSAPGLADAVQLARGCPIFEAEGSVEVRPIIHMT